MTKNVKRFLKKKETNVFYFCRDCGERTKSLPCENCRSIDVSPTFEYKVEE